MITSIPDFNKIQKMSSNPYYTPVSTKLKEILNNYFQNENINTHKADIEQMIMYLINWGFFSSVPPQGGRERARLPPFSLLSLCVCY